MCWEKVNQGVSQTRGFTILAFRKGRGPDCVANPFGSIPCRCFYLRQAEKWGKGQIGKIPETIEENRRKNRESPKMGDSYLPLPVLTRRGAAQLSLQVLVLETSALRYCTGNFKAPTKKTPPPQKKNKDRSERTSPSWEAENNSDHPHPPYWPKIWPQNMP